jgi:hypothetical protein
VPEYEVYWRMSEANESQTSYSLAQAYIFQYQSYSHSDVYFHGKNHMIQNIHALNPLGKIRFKT